MYLRIPFVLMNAGSTFQREMNFSFRDRIQKIIEIYQDDLTIVSNERKHHISHLRIVFERYRKYGISLNPKKSIFRIDKRKLLGHIVSEGGISLDPERIQSIKYVHPPCQQKVPIIILWKNKLYSKICPKIYRKNKTHK
jgi:hypothetical protein